MKNKLICVGLFVLGIMFLNIRSVMAATFSVNTINDTTDLIAGDGICADSIGDCSLRAATQEVNTLAGADVITLPAGTYVLSLGVLNVGTDVTINGNSIESTVIDGNYASRVFSVSGANISNPTININDLTMKKGSSYCLFSSFGGMGIATTNLNNVVVTECNAGGLWNSETYMNVDYARIVNNNGPGINTTYGTFTLEYSTVADNISTGNGGGIYNTGNMTINNSTISNNQANRYAGVYHGSIPMNMTMNVTNSTISGNISNIGTGSGMTNSFGIVNLLNTTITNNSAPSGGGIYIREGIIRYKNTIVSANTGNNCIFDFMSSHVSQGYNIEDTNTCQFDQTGDQINTDPLLEPLGPNGGPTFTHALQTGSPAIENGTGSGAPTIDQRGFNRIGAPDIGAFEYSAGLDESTDITATIPSFLSLVINGVASGISCSNSGGNAGVTSTATQISFGTYYGTQTKIACQTLTVSTNASDGYVVTLQQDEDLTNAGGDTINKFAGSYAMPTIWSSPSGGINSYFGFTTSDTDYSTFQANKYAGILNNDTGYAVARSSGPVSDENNTISYQLEVNDFQPSGTYSNSIMYIATGTF